MITSCLEKSNKKIVIDRLMHISNGVDILVTDPDDIKHLTNEHFQKYTGDINEEKEFQPGGVINTHLVIIWELCNRKGGNSKKINFIFICQIL